MAENGTPPTPPGANDEALALLTALLDIDIVDSEFGNTLCCDGEPDFDWFVYVPEIVRHAATCPWMQGHVLLNKSTVHDEYAHAWRTADDTRRL